MVAPKATAADRTTDRRRQDQNQTDTAIVNQADVDRKREADLVARAALAGLPVYRLAGGTFLAVWGIARALPDEAAVEALLARLGGATA